MVQGGRKIIVVLTGLYNDICEGALSNMNNTFLLFVPT